MKYLVTVTACCDTKEEADKLCSELEDTVNRLNADLELARYEEEED